MHSDGIVCIVVFCSVLIAGCIQMPGVHIISDTPDPVIGQWIAGEPPASDLHMIFYENKTFLSVNYFFNHDAISDTGTWSKIQPGRYSARSVTGESTDWMYDSLDDSVYISKIPQIRYHRYRG
jgi:hypothetical protein